MKCEICKQICDENVTKSTMGNLYHPICAANAYDDLKYNLEIGIRHLEEAVNKFKPVDGAWGAYEQHRS